MGWSILQQRAAPRPFGWRHVAWRLDTLKPSNLNPGPSPENFDFKTRKHCVYAVFSAISPIIYSTTRHPLCWCLGNTRRLWVSLWKYMKIYMWIIWRFPNIGDTPNHPSHWTMNYSWNPWWLGVPPIHETSMFLGWKKHLPGDLSGESVALVSSRHNISMGFF